MSNPNYELFGHQLESPLLNAAGSINRTNVEQIQREAAVLRRTGIGGITYGSFTIPAQEGNAARFGEPVYHYDPFRGETYNSMGLPNIGIEAAEKLLPEEISKAHDIGKIVIASVSPTINSRENGGDSFAQTEQLVQRMLETDADIIEVNLSCPNVLNDGDTRKPILGYDSDSVHTVIDRLDSTVGRTGRLSVKVPPYMSLQQQRQLKAGAEAMKAKPVFRGVVTSNTVPDQIPLDKDRRAILTVPGGKAGMSGPATRQLGRDQTRLWRDELKGELEIVSTLGVIDGREVFARRQLGASAVGGVTFLWESNDWGKAVTRVLEEFSEFERRVHSSR